MQGYMQALNRAIEKAFAHSENDRNEYADAEARSSSKKEKKDNWRLAYLPQRKKKEKPATSKRNKGKVS